MFVTASCCALPGLDIISLQIVNIKKNFCELCYIESENTDSDLLWKKVEVHLQMHTTSSQSIFWYLSNSWKIATWLWEFKLHSLARKKWKNKIIHCIFQYWVTLKIFWRFFCWATFSLQFVTGIRIITLFQQSRMKIRRNHFFHQNTSDYTNAFWWKKMIACA